MSKAAPAIALQQHLVEAMQLHVQGKLDAAREAYAALLGEYPGQPDILHALGTIGMQTRQWDQAAEYFRAALKANPKEARHLVPLARAYVQSGKNDQAIETLIALLAVDLNHEDGQEMLHDLCLPDARAHGVKGSLIDRLIAAHPKVLGLYSVGIRLCRTLDEIVYRLTYLEALYEFGARSEVFCVEYGAMLRNNGQFARCLALAEQWVKDYPDSLDLLRLRGSMYMSLGQHAKGLEDWSKVSARAPDDHSSRGSVGIIKLMVSGCREGFEEFSATRDKVIKLGDFQVPLPEWNGEPLRGKRLILWAGEGLGDTIMFASFLPWIMEQGAEITLAVFPRLNALFQRSFPSARLVPFEPDTLTRCVGECDLQLAFSELVGRGLPHYIPARHPPYLKPDAARMEALRKKYRAMTSKKLIGMSWFTKNKDNFSQRNIPLAQWEPIFALPDIQLVSLQYGADPAEIDEVNRNFPGAIYVDPGIDPVGDIDGLAAQMAALDEIVSVQNTTIHLGGSLGLKTTLLLSAASEWRWGLERTDNQWYKSVTIERQEKIMEWRPVLQRVRERLVGYG